MKIAIVSPGPIRSFSKVYQSWVDNLIKPLEDQVGQGNVKIFIEYFTVDKNHMENLKKMEFHTKAELDEPGWSEILEKSPYIEYQGRYHYDDNYIINIIDNINEFNNCNYSLSNMKKYDAKLQFKDEKMWKKKKRMFYNLIHAVCMNYNNKKIIDKVPDDYDYIIKIRSDAHLLKPYKLDLKNLYNNKNVYFQIASDQLQKSRITFGIRWDTFFMGSNKALKKMYHDYYKKCNLLFVRYMNRNLIRRPEYFIDLLLKESKLNKKTYEYYYHSDWEVITSSYKLGYG